MGEAINNSVLKITDKEAEGIKNRLYSMDKYFVLELDGADIQSWNDYISVIQSGFQFPTPCFDSVDRYLDLMRDLSWLDKEGFALFINNFDLFLKEDLELGEEIIGDFAEVILPFWQDEVKEVVVEGKAKPFMVYLVH